MLFSVFSFPFAELLVFWGGIQHGYNAFTLNPGEFARDITCPTLLLGGEQDQRVPTDTLQDMHKTLQGQKTLHLFKNVGHRHLFSAVSSEYKKILTEFLEGIK